ncbi:MAG: leucine-rich repeat domain-containing protein, partial [Clostridia bacterium]|nr:leucine-rich repeat domain-containing protein [Clostridia bacterium]
FCVSNRFKTLDLSKNTRLEILDCSYNVQMTSLNVSNNTELKELYCNYAKLSSLDITRNKKLIKLICFSNQLNQLDLSENKALEDVNCSKNYLITLDISNNPQIKNLDCTNNNFSSVDDVVGWAKTNLVLEETFKFSPQRVIINPSPVKSSSKIYPLEATYISQHDEDNNKNFYGEPVLKVNYTAKENNSAYWGKYAYLKFDVSNIPKEWIKSAKLKLYVENGTDYRKSTREIGIYDTYMNNWNGSTMTWSSGKVDAKSLLASFTVTATGYEIEDVGWHETDITEYVKYNCIDDKLSLMIKAVTDPAYETTITSGMEGNQLTSNIPVLEIEYEAEAKIMPWRLDYGPSSDTYVYQHEPNENFSDNEILSVNYTSDDTRTDYWGQDTYLSFNIGNMTATAKNNIRRAVLWLYVDESSDIRNSTRTINVSANDGLKYNANTLTWLSNRMIGDINIGDFTVQGNGYVINDPGWRQIDVTEFIKSATNTDIEFILKMTSDQPHPVYIHSMEYPISDTRPKLVIENRTSFVDISDNYDTEVSPSASILYKYIPKSNDEYILSSVGGTGSAAILLDENMNKLAVSENIDGEFKITYNLEKDKKYYINVLANSLIEQNYKLYIETPLEVNIK